MPTILTVQNHPRGPAGLIGAALEASGLALDIRRPLAGDPLPAAPDGFAGLLVLGGAMHAANEAGHPFLADEVRLIAGFLAQGRPVLGICLGAQLMARACGRAVHARSGSELGFPPIALLAAGRDDPLLGGREALPPLLQWHDDSFDLPAGAVLLASTAACRNQAFRLGPGQYGLQGHPEVDDAILADWLDEGQGWLAAERPEALAALVDGRRRALPLAEAVGRDIGRRWAGMIAVSADAPKVNALAAEA